MLSPDVWPVTLEDWLAAALPFVLLLGVIGLPVACYLALRDRIRRVKKEDERMRLKEYLERHFRAS